MSVVVNVKSLQKTLRTVIELKGEFGINVPMFMWGKHGIGKTTIVRDISEELGYNCVVLNLANIPVEDLLGYPDGKGGYHLPDWFVKKSTSSTTKSTIYFLDELPRAPKYVLQGMFNFINEGRLHNHMIGPKDVVIAAGNPDTNDYDQNVFEDRAFLSRFAHFYLEPGVDEYINYLNAHEVHPALIKTVKQFSNKIDNQVSADNRIRCFPDNRALDKIGRVLAVLKHEQVEDVGFNIMASMVGADFATLIYQNYIDSTSIPDIPTLFESIKNKTFSMKKDDFDKFKVINMNLANWVLKLPYENKKGTFSISKEEISAVLFWIEFLPKDFQATLLSEFKSVFNTENASFKVVKFFMQVDPSLITKLLELENVTSAK